MYLHSLFLQHWGRNLILDVAFRCVGLKLKEWGDLAAGLTSVPVSGTIRWFEEKIEKVKTLADSFRQAKSHS